MSYVKEQYNKVVLKKMKEQFGYRNNMEVPKLEKVSLNIAFKTDVDSNFLNYVVNQLALISGQKPIMIKAKKSIASFKLRDGMPIACAVTLRRDKMYEFLDRLIYVALPRVRDFRGLPGKNFNMSGHYSFGIKDHTIFPEVEMDKLVKVLGMNINVITTAKTSEECKALLVNLNFPIK